MDNRTVNVYAGMADGFDRDPYGPDGSGRAQVVNGRGFQKWQRFSQQEVVWVTDADGNPAWLTRTQLDLYQLALTFVDNGTTSIRFLAQVLKCSPSTVSRGMVKLASFGLLAAMTGRGRYSGTLILRLPADGSLKRLREAAKAKVRLWAKQAEARISRLWLNVAPYKVLEEKGTETRDTHYSSIGRNIEAFSVQDLREAGII